MIYQRMKCMTLVTRVNTVSVYCGRYIRITSEDVSVFLNKFEWSYLKELAGSCTDRQILNSVNYTTISYNGERSVSKLIPSVHYLKQMLLILKLCMTS
jgi:hypothetical protein